MSITQLNNDNIVSIDGAKILSAPSFVDNNVLNDISTLALRQASNENKIFYDTASMYVDVFQDATGITGLTNVSRTDEEYVASVIVSQVQVGQGVGTTLGNLVDRGGLASAFDGDKTQGHTSSAARNTPVTIGYIGKDWGNGVTKTISGIKIWPADGSTSAVAWDSLNVGGAQTVTLTFEGSTDNFSSSIVSLGTLATAHNKSSTANLSVLSGFTTTTAYRYHRVKIISSGGSFEPVVAELEFYEDNITANATGSFTSNNITASASTTSMGAVITYQDQAGTNALNSDIVLKLSADGGSNYATATLTAMPDFDTGIKMAKVNDLSVTAGTSLKYKIEFANQASGSKEARIRGVSLQY